MEEIVSETAMIPREGQVVPGHGGARPGAGQYPKEIKELRDKLTKVRLDNTTEDEHIEIWNKLKEKALEGNIPAIGIYMERTEGKVVDTSEQDEGQGGMIIKLVRVVADIAIAEPAHGNPVAVGRVDRRSIAERGGRENPTPHV